MPLDKQLKTDGDELLDDIHYINQAAKEEIKRVDARMRQYIAEAPLPAKVADSLADEISTQLGQLSARVKIAEKAIRSLQAKQKPKKKAKIDTAKADSFDQSSDLKFEASELVGNRNLLAVELSTSGINYCWSGADPEIQFSFFLDRSKKLEMQIWLFALIKPEYSKQMKVLIDGKHIKHRFTLDGSLFVVSCLLPSSDKSSQTSVKVVLPSTHSPTDLGSSLDGRKLGIAISEIRFGKPDSGFGRLLKRLRLKK